MPINPGQNLNSYGEKGVRFKRLWETALFIANAREPVTAQQVKTHLEAMWDFGDTVSINTVRADLRLLRELDLGIVQVSSDGQVIDFDDLDDRRGKIKGSRWTVVFPKKKLNAAATYRRIEGVTLLSFVLMRSLARSVLPQTGPKGTVERLLGLLWNLFEYSLKHHDSGPLELESLLEKLGPEYVGEIPGSEVIRHLLKAKALRQVVQASYMNRHGEISQVDLAPLRFFVDKGRLYVVAAGGTDGKVRLWRCDRLDKVLLTQRPFPTIDEAEVEEVVANAFGGWHTESAVIVLAAELELEEYLTSYQFHPTQKLERDHGKLQVSLECGVGLPLEQWILGFGEKVEVLEPPELRERIRQRHEAAAKCYRPSQE